MYLCSIALWVHGVWEFREKFKRQPRSKHPKKQVKKREKRSNNTAKTVLKFKSPNQVVSEYFSE